MYEKLNLIFVVLLLSACSVPSVINVQEPVAPFLPIGATVNSSTVGSPVSTCGVKAFKLVFKNKKKG